MRTAEAISHGAISVVNAMATGKGAALGIQLWTKARVTLTDNPGQIRAHIIGAPSESTSLTCTTVKIILNALAKKYGAVVETESNIPIAVGLKSSSAASNAVAAATLTALGPRTKGIEIVRFGVRSSLKARVTVTGAFDDACACFFGGLVVTDNRTSRILKRYRPSRVGNQILLYVPDSKRYSGDIRKGSFKKITRLVELAHDEALRRNYLLSLTLNGIAYSSVLGYDLSPVNDALGAGALAAGLSGKGPAIAAIVPDRKVEHVISAWKAYPGRIIETALNLKQATARVLN